jgi:hypothetical protein
MNEQKQADFYVGELLHELDVSAQDGLSLRHPMAFGETVGRDRVELFVAATASVFSEIKPTLSWKADDMSAREWHGLFHDHLIRGVTVVRRFDKRLQVDIFFASFPRLMRQALRDSCREFLDTDQWRLPPGIDTSLPFIPDNEILDAKLPFGFTSDVFLTSPVACKPVRGIADVERLCGHSILVYGERVNGPRLTVGATTLSLWTGSVSGLPLEVANVIHWGDAQHAKGMAMAMRPWPVVALFQARMQARTLPFLDMSYFESGINTSFQHGEV